MHPALRKGPFLQKVPTPPIFHFFTKSTPILLPAYGPAICVCVRLSEVGVLSTEMNGLMWFLARRFPSTSLTL